MSHVVRDDVHGGWLISRKKMGCGVRAVKTILLSAALLSGLMNVSWACADKVELKRNQDGRWQLVRGGQPWVIHGVCRFIEPEDRIPIAISCGVNTVRTYGDGSPLTQKVITGNLSRMDTAQKNGLAVMCGIWVQRESKNFNYANSEHINKQRDVIRNVVRVYKDHPSLLLWNLGNEAEGSRTKELHPEFWAELGELAKIVKEEDPNHPVITAIAGPTEWKLKAIKEYCGSLDAIGINAYGQAGEIPERLDKAGLGDKPFVLTEYGPRGHWEVKKTDWDAPIEPMSEAKSANYEKCFRDVMADPKGRCLGANAFVFAAKQEITATWYGMFLKSGEKTPAVDALCHAYSGKWPVNRSPKIISVESELALSAVPPHKEFSAIINVMDAENDPLTYEWAVIRESGVRWAEGSVEPVPPTIEGCILTEQGPGITLRTPDKPGAYRLFVYVRDGKGGAATQNLPFLVQAEEKR